MRKFAWRRAVLSLPLVLALCLMGAWIGWWLLGKYAEGEFARWSPLTTPPEKPLRIAGLNPRRVRDVDVYVETLSGKTYMYSCCSQRDATWQEAQLPDDQFHWPCYEQFDDPRHVYFASLPADVIDCHQVSWMWEWANDDSFFVLLEDDTLWRWRHYVALDTGAAFLCSGASIGAISGLGLASAFWARRQPRSTNSRREDEAA